MMNRRHFLVTSLLAAGGTSLSARAAAPEKEKQAPLGKAVPGAPTVTALAPDGVSIVWCVNGLCSGYVEYGPTKELGLVAYGAVDGLRSLDEAAIAIRLPGLKPGERVFYRTVTAPIRFPNHYAIKRGEAVASAVLDFRMPGAGDTAKIAVWNDTHQQKDSIVAAGKFTDAFAPDLLVLNGDMVGDQFNRTADFTGTFFALDSGSPAWSNRPVAFVRGNHDARGSIARELPRFAPRPRADGYHGLLRCGPVGIIQLDTGDDKEGPGIYGELGDFAAYREAQKIWLEEAVKHPDFAGAPFRIVFCHIPLKWKRPEGKGDWCPDGDARWSPVLAKAGVHAVISGHTHEFWHDAATPARPFHQIVSGGPQTKTTGWSKTPACVVTLDATQQTLVLRVTEALSGKEHLKLEFKA